MIHKPMIGNAPSWLASSHSLALEPLVDCSFFQAKWRYEIKFRNFDDSKPKKKKEDTLDTYFEF